MILYKIIIRDWKGIYDEAPKGWKFFAGEESINTGGDFFATIFSKGRSVKKMSGQEIYDIHDSLLCGEDINGYDLDSEDDSILIENEAKISENYKIVKKIKKLDRKKILEEEGFCDNSSVS